ncbi:putative ATP-dependent RNA helicase [Proteus phage vB_PmiM_ZX7]|nr:putative ATP-dependent RNA helicase [Proteus phage vB_PmiM_ZX7]
MSFQLRPYQRDAVESAKEELKKCVDPILIEAATGAGKSLLVSELAIWLKETSGKKVLCTAPSKELVEQNAEKYRSYGFSCSMYSASVGKKSIAKDVVFGTPGSIVNDLHKFDDKFSAIVIDEAHSISPTIKKIVAHMKEHNPNLRVIGMTATPYRLGDGYIFSIFPDGTTVGEDQTRNPFFKKLVYRITAQELISQGYLTPPIADAELALEYDAKNLQLNSRNQFNSKDVEAVFEGQGRLTADIVADVVEKSRNRKGVMFFGATIQHAYEIASSLPKEQVEVVTGKTKKKDRESIIKRFKNQEFKYLVNVSALTTGFDAPHVDVVAILRATESASLLQQIIGRGLRLDEGKLFCLVLDYAGNIERHGLEDDLFAPDIKVAGGCSGSGKLEVVCPDCSCVNSFSVRKGADLDNVDSEGYQLDLAGDRIMLDGQPVPAHMGRRCFGEVRVSGHYVRCSHRWSLKICPECEEENDIASKYCSACRHELVDPNTKLEIDYKKMKKNPRIMTTDKVIRWECKEWMSSYGNKTLRVDYTTEYRTFPVWYSPYANNIAQQELWKDLCMCVFGKVAPSPELFMLALRRGHGKMPSTVTVKKEGEFFRVYKHNEEEVMMSEQ